MYFGGGFRVLGDRLIKLAQVVSKLKRWDGVLSYID